MLSLDGGGGTREGKKNKCLGVGENRGGEVKEKWVISSGVGCQGVLNPVEELAHFDVDSGVVRHGTSLTP